MSISYSFLPTPPKKLILTLSLGFGCFACDSRVSGGPSVVIVCIRYDNNPSTGLVNRISYHNIQSLSLPISSFTAIAAVLIPILNGASIVGSQLHDSRSHSRSRSRSRVGFVRGSNNPSKKAEGFISWPTVVNNSAFLALTMYETVIATLALTHIVRPDDLICGLQRQWYELYSNKDATAIRRIQDGHQCCGLVTPKDHAWPFQDKNTMPDACITAFDRHKGCLLDWRQDEQIYAGLLLVVALSAIGLKVCSPLFHNMTHFFVFLFFHFIYFIFLILYPKGRGKEKEKERKEISLLLFF